MNMNKNYTGMFRGDDHKKVFAQQVDELLSVILSAPARVLACANLVETYTDEVREVPDSNQLSRLTSYILVDDLTNSHPDKVTREEYPMLTKSQQIRRSIREKVVGEDIERASHVKAYNKTLRCGIHRKAS